MKNFFKNTSVFDVVFRILLILLPFTTILSVWTNVKLGIPGFSFYKEALILVMFLIFAWNVLGRKITLKFTLIDILILSYIVSMLVITVFTTGLSGIIYGGRYDFSFLLVFWLLYHGASLLRESTAYYLRLFLISGGIMLFLSWLLKWPLTEDLLLVFGYCGNPSNWHDCGGIPPIFHGIDGANVRRFQWLLDGPNTMWAFLIFFAWIFTYYMRMRKDWYFVVWLILIGIMGMIVYTYSRSALLGSIGAIGVAIMWNLRTIYRHYKKEFIIISLIGILWVWVLGLKYGGHIGAIIGRAGSTKWHFERMVTSIERFQSHPLGQWLGSSGPGYRHVIPEADVDMEEKDRFYIPESWYIQQFVEGWVIGGILFLAIMLTLFLLLMKEHAILGAMFAWVGIMNLFLHTFESSVLVLPMFMLIGLILSHHRKRLNQPQN